jgi:ABC-type branched-subunit amino acid transport system ATPase component
VIGPNRAGKTTTFNLISERRDGQQSQEVKMSEQTNTTTKTIKIPEPDHPINAVAPGVVATDLFGDTFRRRQ